MSTATAKGLQPQASIRHSVVNGTPTVELTVPKGTTFAQASALQARLAPELIAKFSPKGCPGCFSGLNMTVREELGDAIFVAMPEGL